MYKNKVFDMTASEFCPRSGKGSSRNINTLFLFVISLREILLIYLD
jgi:hypothetical protein